MNASNQRSGWWRVGGLLALVLACGVMSVNAERPQGAAPQSATDLFQQAMHQEDAVGNVETALGLYRRVLAAKPDRALAARAQLRIGVCLEKMGKSEARQAFESVVRDYADQTAIVTDARTRLGNLGTTGTKAPAGTGLEATQLLAGADVDVNASVSPDGRYLAFVDYGAGGNLAVMDLTTGARRLLTRDAALDGGGSFAGFPAFSPDGSRVAYAWYGKETSLRIIDRDGSKMRILAAGMNVDFPYAWSLDGRLIAVNLYQSGQSRIAIASVDNGSITPLKSTAWRKADVGGFSPDGKFLVYSLTATPSAPVGGVFLLAVDGGSETKVADGNAPAWTPDGRAVVFVSDRSGTNGLWVVPVTDGKLKGEAELLRPNIGTIANQGFTRDGAFFYGTRSVGRDVLVAGLDPGRWHMDAPVALTQASVGSNAGAAWSPDGRRVAFFRGRNTLVIRSVAKGEERTVPTKLEGAVVLQGSRWFPDGRSLLMQDASGDGRQVYRKIDVETGAQQVIHDTVIGTAFPPFDLSPDGRFFYYVQRGDEEADGLRVIRLIRRNIQTTDEAELYRSKTAAGGFRFAVSPDGMQVAFKAGNQSVLLLLPTAGGSPVELYRGDASHPVPIPLAWTRDGRHILGAGVDAVGNGDRDRLFAIPVSGGVPVKLDYTGAGMIDRLSVSPTDNAVVISVTRPSKELWVVRNLLRQSRSR